VSGLSESTVKRYIDELNDFSREMSFVDGRSVRWDKNVSILQQEIDKMNSEGVVVTKAELHKRTGISRPTINRHWGKLIHLIK
jgi:predicted DNA-binding transcriptional regulator AlpA